MPKRFVNDRQRVGRATWRMILSQDRGNFRDFGKNSVKFPASSQFTIESNTSLRSLKEKPQNREKKEMWNPAIKPRTNITIEKLSCYTQL